MKASQSADAGDVGDDAKPQQADPESGDDDDTDELSNGKRALAQAES